MLSLHSTFEVQCKIFIQKKKKKKKKKAVNTKQKIRTLVRVSGSPEVPLVTVGSVISNIQQCTLSPHRDPPFNFGGSGSKNVVVV